MRVRSSHATHRVRSYNYTPWWWTGQDAVQYMHESQFMHGEFLTEARAERMAAEGSGPAVTLLLSGNITFAQLVQRAANTVPARRKRPGNSGSRESK